MGFEANESLIWCTGLVSARDTLIAEMIVTKDLGYAEQKLEQLEAALMREGICHPLQVITQSTRGCNSGLKDFKSLIPYCQ